MFGVELVEGKDRPHELPSLNPHRRGKTVELLARLCAPLAHTGKIVVLDSGFCVLSGILLLATMGIYAAAQIKKRRYWPTDVPGEAIKSHMQSEPNGSIKSVIGERDMQKYSIFAVKEPTYVSMISTYGFLDKVDYTAIRHDVAAGNERMEL